MKFKLVHFFAALVAAAMVLAMPAQAQEVSRSTLDCSNIQQYRAAPDDPNAQAALTACLRQEASAKAKADADASAKSVMKDSGNGTGTGIGGSAITKNETRVFAPVLPSMIAAALPPLPPGLPGQMVVCVPPGKVVREPRTFSTTGRLGGVFFEKAPNDGLYTEIWQPEGGTPPKSEKMAGVDVLWGTVIYKTTILSSAALQGQIMVGGAVSNGALQVGGAGGGAVQDPVDRITVGGTCVLNREEVEFRLRIAPQEMKPVTGGVVTTRERNDQVIKTWVPCPKGGCKAPPKGYYRYHVEKGEWKVTSAPAVPKEAVK